MISILTLRSNLVERVFAERFQSQAWEQRLAPGIRDKAPQEHAALQRKLSFQRRLCDDHLAHPAKCIGSKTSAGTFPTGARDGP